MTALNSLFNGFSASSRVWIYIAHPGLTEEQAQSLYAEANAFTATWQTHGKPLKAAAEIVFRNVLLLAVDGTYIEASGCAIDKQMHWIKRMEEKYATVLTQRMLIPVVSEYTVICSKAEAQPNLTNQTKVIDCTLTMLGDVRTGLVKSMDKTWMRKFLQNTASNLHN